VRGSIAVSVLRAGLARLESRRVGIELVHIRAGEMLLLKSLHTLGLDRVGLSNGAPRCRRGNSPAAIWAAREIDGYAVQDFVAGEMGDLDRSRSPLLIRTIHVAVGVDACGRNIGDLVEEQAQWVWHLHLSTRRFRTRCGLG